MSDEPQDIGHEEAVADAFLNSHNHKLGDLQLEPYTPPRRIAAQAIGLFYGTLDEAAIAQLEATKLYSGVVRDVAVVLWLCSLKDDPANGITAERLIDDAARDRLGSIGKAAQFADEHDMVDTSAKGFWEAYTVFMRIQKQVADSRVDAKKKMTSQSIQKAPSLASGLTT